MLSGHILVALMLAGASDRCNKRKYFMAGTTITKKAFLTIQYSSNIKLNFLSKNDFKMALTPYRNAKYVQKPTLY